MPGYVSKFTQPLLSQGKDVARKGCPMGFSKESVVLVVNTEADTDPELYQRILSGGEDA